ncbi:MAG: NUDIX domain-containing protein [Candidatus Eremiobacteraeota bacterium]|nr:NUDIX domain-containing protein [Candidatus Eremiobacteraeota bacterium]
MSANVIMYIKGSSRGNPGPAGVGVIICDHWGRVVKKIGEYIGVSTTAQAEFRALLRGIEEMRSMNAFRVKIFSDNEPLIKHMTGIYKVKGDELVGLLEQIKALSKGLSLEFIQIHALRNREAELLAREALEKESSKSLSPNQGRSPQGASKGEIDIKAVRAALQRAMLLEDITKVKPEAPETPLHAPQEAPAPPPAGIDEGSLQHEKDLIDDLCPEEREERQISAGGVVYKKEGQRIKVCLIAKKDKRVWALPKGRLQPGENLEETARREIAEETGHLTEVREKIDEISYHFYWKEANVFYHKTVYFFLMPVIQENFYPRDGEVDDVIWLTLGEAYKKLTYLNEKEILRKAQKILVKR